MLLSNFKAFMLACQIPVSSRHAFFMPRSPLPANLMGMDHKPADAYKIPSSSNFPSTSPLSNKKVDFSTESLSHLDSSSVARLYENIKLQCDFCALRMDDSDQMAKHLDRHFKLNLKRREKDKQLRHRMWYMDSAEWSSQPIDFEGNIQAPVDIMNADSIEHAEKSDNGNDIASSKVPVDDENVTHCAICGEKLEQIWDDDADSWVYTNAVKAKLDPKKENEEIIHQSCFKDL